MKALYLYAFTLLLLFSCSDGKEDIPVKEIFLTADRSQTIADGVETITFTVVTLEGDDITTEAKIFIDDREIPGNSYSSTEAGTFTVVAHYEGVSSKPIEITFEKEEIFLTADRSQTIADGVQAITFTVTTLAGSDITAEAKIFINDTEIPGHSYASTEAGTFTVVAQYKGAASQALEVTFEKIVDADLRIKSSKNVIVSDGIDRVEFSCATIIGDEQYPFGGEVTYFIDGQAIEGNVFSTTTPGSYKVSAQTKTAKIEEIEIVAQTKFVATGKIFVELVAATWCPYCPAGLFYLNELVTDPRVVAMCIHPQSDQDPFQCNDEGKKMYTSLGVGSVPTVILNRDKNKMLVGPEQISNFPPEYVLGFVDSRPKLGIALTCEVKDAGRIEAKAYVAATENMSDVKCVALLVENHLVHDQNNNIKPELGNPIKNFEHNHVYRNCYDSGIWGENVSLTSEKILEKTFVFTPDPSYVKENCEVIVLITNSKNEVLNVQQVKVGHQIGY